jgi:outer membrane lipoprotein SlyB
MVGWKITISPKKGKTMKHVILLAVSALLLTSCARQIDSDVYTTRQVGEVSTTYAGVIRNIREVCVQEGSQLEDNGLGMVGGGVAGGVVGSAVGRGHFVPTAFGAVAGAVTGSLLEKKMKQQIGYEYVVELYNGGLITVVQGRDQCFGIGQPVYVMMSPYGRSRIVPQ